MDIVRGPIDRALLRAMDGLIEQGSQWHLDDFGHFVRAWLEEQTGRRRSLRSGIVPEPGDHRGYHETTYGHVDLSHSPDHLQAVGLYAKLLMSLAQRGEHGV